MSPPSDDCASRPNLGASVVENVHVSHHRIHLKHPRRFASFSLLLCILRKILRAPASEITSGFHQKLGNSGQVSWVKDRMCRDPCKGACMYIPQVLTGRV